MPVLTERWSWLPNGLALRLARTYGSQTEKLSVLRNPSATSGSYSAITCMKPSCAIWYSTSG